MKLGCIFLFTAFLLNNFQASDAVKCLVGRKLKTCSSCVYYTCKKNDKYVSQIGCPEDFFRYCAKYEEAVEFVKRKKYNDLQYDQFNVVAYVSGCGEEIYGDACIEAKFKKFNEKLINRNGDVCIEEGRPCSVYKNGASKMNGILSLGLMVFAWIY